MAKHIINSFNGGELSPYLVGRSDIQQYKNSCFKLRNMTALPFGSAIKRKGTEFLGLAKNESETVLIEFSVSTEINYILEFGNGYIRFYDIAGQIYDGLIPLEISSPFLTSELVDIKYKQSADTLYLCHPNHKPKKLTRDSTIPTFSISDVEFTEQPFMDENLDDTHTMTFNGTTLTSSKSFFDIKHIGAFFQLKTEKAVTKIVKTSWTGTQNSESMPIFGKWGITTHGGWSGQVIVQRSTDEGVTWGNWKTINSNDDRNEIFNDEEDEDNVLMRVRIENVTDGASSGTGVSFELFNDELYDTGVLKVTGFNSDTSVNADIIVATGSVSTNVWNEGAWSDYRGYPKCIAFFENRLFFAGTKFQPQTLWGSKTNNFLNFRIGVLDTSALIFSLNSNQLNAIQWIEAQQKLLIGTTGGEWSIGAGRRDEAFTVTNVQVLKHSNYGSGSVDARLINDVVLYFQDKNKIARMLEYSYEKEGFQSPNLTLLSEHITGTGIKEMVFQRQPYSIVWALRYDGKIIGMTFEKKQEVTGWHYHDVGGRAESIAVIAGDEEDIVYIIVNRNGKRCIERLYPKNDRLNYVDSSMYWKGDAGECFCNNEFVTTAEEHNLNTGNYVRISDVVYYVDYLNANQFKIMSLDGLRYVNATGDTFEEVRKQFLGINHLEGETVTGLGDNKILEEKIVNSGSITLDYFYNEVTLGLKYMSILAPMPMLPVLDYGSADFTKKQATEVAIRFKDSFGCKISSDLEKFDDVYFEIGKNYGDGNNLFTGVLRHNINMQWNDDAIVYITSETPYPLEVLSMGTLIKSNVKGV